MHYLLIYGCTCTVESLIILLCVMVLPKTRKVLNLNTSSILVNVFRYINVTFIYAPANADFVVLFRDWIIAFSHEKQIKTRNVASGPSLTFKKLYFQVK